MTGIRNRSGNASGTQQPSPRDQLGYRELYEHLSNAIISDTIRTGDRLASERQLMDQFGATRNTVRKVLEALVRNGFVVRRRGSGSYASLAKPNRALIGFEASKIGPLDVLETRLIFEPGFVDLIVLRATPADFARMEACLDRADRAKTQDEFREAAEAFRNEAVNATRNPLMIQIYEFISDARKAAGWHRLRKVDETKEAQRERTQRNRAILAALRDRNKPLARKLIKERLSLMVTEVTTGSLVDDSDSQATEN